MRYLGLNLAQNEKTRKVGYFVASVTHDRSEKLRWKNFHIFTVIWQVKFAIQNS